MNDVWLPMLSTVVDLPLPMSVGKEDALATTLARVGEKTHAVLRR